MDEVKVSIIIPTYKRAEDIGKAVKSALGQTLKEIEVIVVDDNPPDTEDRLKTREIMHHMQKEDERLIYIEHPENMNGSAARNTGIREARGEFIAFLDDDDEYLPDKMRIQYNQIKTLPNEYGGVMSDCYISRNGKIVKKLAIEKKDNALIETLACTYVTGSGSNLFIRRSVIDDIGGFDERLLRHQDYDFLVRLFFKYKIYVVEIPLFTIEQRSSHLNTPNLPKLEKAKKIYLDKYKETIDTLPLHDKALISYSHSMSLCETAIRGKLIKEAKQYYQSAKTSVEISANQKVRLFLLACYSYIPNQIRKSLKFGK